MDPTDSLCQDGVLCWRLEVVAKSILKVVVLYTKKHCADPIFQSISVNYSICTKGMLLDIEYSFQQMELQTRTLN